VVFTGDLADVDDFVFAIRKLWPDAYPDVNRRGRAPGWNQSAIGRAAGKRVGVANQHEER
ncbi:MAG: hypothetical protein E7K05_09710, partial [Serratia marcescens]|nr:hypothetical protein [Serratia marcescens]